MSVATKSEVEQQVVFKTFGNILEIKMQEFMSYWLSYKQVT